jgi:hypothetical protein
MEEPIKIGKAMTDPAKAQMCTAPTAATLPSSTSESAWLQVTIHQGKKWQVRRLCGRSRLNVIRLRRVQFGPIELGVLKQGDWRALTQVEVDACYQLADPTCKQRPIACSIPQPQQQQQQPPPPPPQPDTSTGRLQSSAATSAPGAKPKEAAKSVDNCKRKRAVLGATRGARSPVKRAA